MRGLLYFTILIYISIFIFLAKVYFYFTRYSKTLYGTNLSPPIAVILVKPAFLI